MSEHYSNVGNIRKDLRALLETDPLLTAKKLAKLLDLPYKSYRNYLTKERSQWKYYHENERGSNVSNLHCFRGWVRLRRGELWLLDRKAELEGFGWKLSKARNRFWILRERLGTIKWFETGLVLLSVKAPGNLGKAKQLFCDGFVSRGLLTDLKVMNQVLERVREHNVHAPYKTPMRLPRLTISDFAESHGIIIKVGDRSHPNCVEVIASWSENMMKIANFFDDLRLGGLNGNGAPKPIGEDYSS